MKALDEDI